MILDRALLETLYYDYCSRLINYGNRLLNERCLAEDIVQDAYYKLWIKYVGQHKLLSQWTSLLFSIVRNQCIDHLRKARKVRNDNYSIVRLPDVTNEPALYSIDFNNPYRGLSKTIVDELTAEITKIESNLSETTRTIFYMSRVEHLRNKDIAERLNISVKTVEKHITIALKAFKKQLEKSGF